MPGTKAGGQKAAATNKARYGTGFYADIGRKGGKNGHTGGFASLEASCKCDAFPEPHRYAHCAGIKGGRKSRRGKAERRVELSQVK